MDSNEIVKNEFFVQPGFIHIPESETLLYAVVGSGIVVTFYDIEMHYGGMSYFAVAKRLTKEDSTPYYAYPALIGLLNIMIKMGSKIENIEAHIFGGAENINAKNYHPERAQENINAAYKILNKKNILITGSDTGSKRGRKVMFNTLSGETMVAKVNKIRESDWYPQAVS